MDRQSAEVKKGPVDMARHRSKHSKGGNQIRIPSPEREIEEEEPRSATAKHIKTERGKKPTKITDTRSQRKARMLKYVQFKPGERFNKRAWEVIRLIDSGGFGVVYEAWNNDKSIVAALKAEPTTTTGESQLKQEILVLQSVNPHGKAEHFPRIFCAVKHKNFAYIIMSLLGENLRNLRSCEVKNGIPRPKEMIRKQDHYLLSIGSWSRVGMQLLYAIKTLHDCGFVHRDIKPANFVIGKGQEMTTIFMLDFGLSRAYSFKGRRDDIWSFFYILIEAHCGLPWQFEIDRKELERVKCTISDEELAKNMPKSLRDCICSLRHLDIYSRPDYTAIYEALLKAKKLTKTNCDDLYDWEKYNEDYKRPASYVPNQYHGWSHNALAHFQSLVIPSLIPADAYRHNDVSSEATEEAKHNSKKVMSIPQTPGQSFTPQEGKTMDSKTDAETRTEMTKEQTDDVGGSSKGKEKRKIIMDEKSKTENVPREQTKSASSNRKTKEPSREVQTYTDVSSKKSGKDSNKDSAKSVTQRGRR
ncbi:hypothetical protein PRIPAC_75605 [Pristionchus pacificus]|uniref:Protein kinase domain-containing protein n=1 Tax=Pristionchus pacificus TaxID=54126 RepID=A0A2A6D021_PRIPA|nr:hypothetical protein PRIPAC_75605 [Pristionchus pacificus]|eukprot:PDM83657.1 protein kinase [Pristionchus pacificus]